MTEPSDVHATRAAYNTVAVDYAELLRNELHTKPYDRAMLGTFAELVQSSGGEAVADIGCGPGRITAHLRSLGLAAFGIDLSPEMVAVARRDHPSLQFSEGSMEALELADGTLDGIVAWYSIIHTPPARLPRVFGNSTGPSWTAACCCSRSKPVTSPGTWASRMATRSTSMPTACRRTTSRNSSFRPAWSSRHSFSANRTTGTRRPRRPTF
ncbi:malonyl-[acyl-carrier protein] O-methyltransferase [Arthrobacter sp. Hiyo8]|nr:malonyl-[acyl-carrier protein] O-methyltransferase [Arthrobacter sp. Hiyo8]